MQPSADSGRRQLFAERGLPRDRKAKQKARAHLVYTEEEDGTVSSDYEGENDDEEPDEFEDETYGTERSKKPATVNKKRPRAPRQDAVEDDIKQTMSHIGVAAEEIVKLINNEETKESVIRKTGFSPNYVMKLQRRVLRASPGTVPYSGLAHAAHVLRVGSSTAAPLA
jgi:hypothetical protein